MAKVGQEGLIESRYLESNPLKIFQLIYSLGTSNRSKEAFLEILNHYGIDLVVDVRSYPTSRFEHFKREALERFLDKAGIDYLYLGNELGGYRKGGYENHMGTPLYEQGLNIVESKAKGMVLSLLCAERLPWRCHRRFIGKSLKERGWRVLHIIEKERIWETRDEDKGEKD